MTYDELLEEASNYELIVKEKPLQGNKGRIKGNIIAIKKDIPTTKEKACVLAEELAHKTYIKWEDIKMLDEKDLQAIAGLINGRATQTEKLIEERTVHTESMLLDEMERYDNKNSKRFDGITKDLEELKAFYRMAKTENETINMLLRIIENLEKRVSELEKKTA